MIWIDFGIVIYLTAGMAAGVLWERRRSGGTGDLRRDRNQLRNELRQARAACDAARTAAMADHPAGSGLPRPTGRQLYSVRGGRG
jgi:hypothetical protein